MTPLRACLADVMAKLLVGQPLTSGKVALAWHLAVGPALARATTVRLRDDGVIEVSATNEHWREEVVRALPVIRQRLRPFVGDAVKDLEIQ